jgi:hypothetical protein
MTLLKAVIQQDEEVAESPLHVFPHEVILLFWQDLVDIYFHEKTKVEWTSEKGDDFSFV